MEETNNLEQANLPEAEAPEQDLDPTNQAFGLQDEPKAAEDNKPKEEAPPAVPKVYKARAGDKDFEIPADAVWEFESKKGEKIRLTTEELRSDAYGKQEISRRLNEIDKLSKEHSAQLKFAQQARDILESHQGFDKVDKLLGELHKYDPSLREAIVQYNQKLYEEALAVSQMDEAQRRQYFLEKENEGLKAQQLQSVEAEQQAQIQGYISERAQRIEQHSGLPKEELQQMYNSYRQELEASGQLDSLTLDKYFDAFEYKVGQKLRMDSAYDVLKDIDQDKASRIASNPMDMENQDVKDLLELYYLLEARPSMSKQELKSKAEKLFGKSKQIQEATEKARESQRKLPPKKKDFGKPSSSLQDVNSGFAELRRKYNIGNF